ncbi:MAG TPA: hypothetical protein VFZ42_09190 [Chitinophagaceae bacterium]
MNSKSTGIGRRIIEFIFYGNYFYGVCAVALAIEASLQQKAPINSFSFYLILFIITVLYYTHPYVRKGTGKSKNLRTNWYTRYYSLVFATQVVFTIILLLSLVLFVRNHSESIIHITTDKWMLILLFPIVAALYYGLNFLSRQYNLRRIGWLKPFLIGFTWAGLVTIYPVLFQTIINSVPYEPTWLTLLLFLKNMMFISVLCIMFDIKDYASDVTSPVKTFVVKMGLKKTIFYILVPLTVIGLGTFITYALTQGFNAGKLFLNIIPFILLLLAAWSLRRPRSLLYYLVVIDGLMLVKALCGTCAMLYF